MALTRAVELSTGQVIMTVPVWRQWQDALNRAAAREDCDDAGALLSEVLLVSAQRTDGSLLRRSEIEGLPVQDGDALLIALSELLEQQSQQMALAEREFPDWIELEGQGVALRLRSWTFGERNEALRQALRPWGQGVHLDITVFERAMVLRCVTEINGQPLSPEQVSAWPVALGEAVMAALDRLCAPAAGEQDLLERSVNAGLDHPDLALVRLCQAFGWSPQEVERMDARLGERLLGALRVTGFQNTPAASPVGNPPGIMPQVEGVTRILVRDD